MARTVAIIQQEIIDNLTLKGIAVSDSVTSIRRIWTWVIAIAHNLFEQILDIHYNRTLAQLQALKPGTLGWYRQKVFDFQLGGTLIPDTDVYDNTGLTDAQVTAQKVVANNAVIKEDGAIKIKVVKMAGSDYVPLDGMQFTALSYYIENNVQYAGDEIVFVNAAADTVVMDLVVRYDPEVMKSNGDLLDGTVEPARAAAKDFFRNTNFNGRYYRSRHLAALELVRGVTDAKITGIVATDVNGNVTDIDMQYQPFSGFMRIMLDADLTITYIPQN
jgi:hypothetical protein